MKGSYGWSEQTQCACVLRSCIIIKINYTQWRERVRCYDIWKEESLHTLMMIKIVLSEFFLHRVVVLSLFVCLVMRECGEKLGGFWEICLGSSEKSSFNLQGCVAPTESRTRSRLRSAAAERLAEGSFLRSRLRRFFFRPFWALDKLNWPTS